MLQLKFHPDSVVRRSVVSAGIIFLTACGAVQKQTHESQAQVIAGLASQASEFEKAIIHKDISAIEAALTDDFRLIRSSGEVDNKETFLQGFKSADLTTDPYTVEDQSIRLYGDSALVSGKVKMTGITAGVAFTLHYRFIHTFIRSGEKWLICNSQITPIQQRSAT
ncbi:nuclear transport factor 2 family protein [Geothrix paludis]|uniref:nuclear transport factor 2 family protein n=1 Tax=Geothrix paludis TaxID=2922722 RepID=UPI001FAD59F7|nr:nuclear transport factor 2 family protein [Geothrix paludis]